MPKISRLGDRCFGVCSHPIHIPPISIGGTITTAAATSNVEGKLAARVGDIVTSDCGHTGIIITGANLALEGSPVARVGDAFAGFYNGTIIEGCSKTDAQ